MRKSGKLFRLCISVLLPATLFSGCAGESGASGKESVVLMEQEEDTYELAVVSVSDVVRTLEIDCTYQQMREYEVTRNQHVDKGDVIASVRVAGDEIGLMRYERQRDRLKERIEDLMAQRKEGGWKELAAKQEELSEVERQIDEEDIWNVTVSYNLFRILEEMTRSAHRICT